MALFQNMDPNTKKLLLVGIPIVAVIAFVVILKGKSSTSSSTTSTTGTTTTPSPYPGTAVDTGQLAAYESTVSDQLAQIASTLDGSSSTPAATPTTPSPTSPTPATPTGTTFAQEGTNFVGRGPQGAFVGISSPQVAQQYISGGDTLYTYAPAGGFEPTSANEQGTIPGEFLNISTVPYGGVTPAAA